MLRRRHYLKAYRQVATAASTAKTADNNRKGSRRIVADAARSVLRRGKCDLRPKGYNIYMYVFSGIFLYIVLRGFLKPRVKYLRRIITHYFFIFFYRDTRVADKRRDTFNSEGIAPKTSQCYEREFRTERDYIFSAAVISTKSGEMMGP